MKYQELRPCFISASAVAFDSAYVSYIQCVSSAGCLQQALALSRLLRRIGSCWKHSADAGAEADARKAGLGAPGAQPDRIAILQERAALACR